MFEFTCQCGKVLKAAAELAGKRGKCPRCGRQFVISPPASLSAESTSHAAVSLPPAPAKLATAAFASRQHLLSQAQVVPDAMRCVQCGICTHNCPMGIDVRAHAWRGLAIQDSHCLTCSECVKRCPRGVLNFERIPLLATN